MNEKYPVIRNVAAIPEHLKLTHKARYATDPNDPVFGEKWIRFEQQNPPFLVNCKLRL